MMEEESLPNCAVVYQFTSPSGKSYIGKRKAPDCDNWPNEGNGPLPDGYTGSGTYWKKAINKYGVEAMTWLILGRFPCEDLAYEFEPLYMLEAQANGKKLYNIWEGGKGSKSADIKRMWADPNSRVNQPEFREKLIAANKRRWADPEYRRLHREAVNRPEVVKRQSERQKAYFAANPDYRAEKIRVLRNPEALARAKETMQTPEHREKLAKHQKRLWADPDSVFNTPEHRAKLTSITADRWADPEFKTKMSRILNTPERKAKQSALHKEISARPEVKAKQSVANKEAQNRPEVKAKRSAMWKEKWADPEYRAKQAAKRSSPEQRAKMRAVWADPEVRARRLTGMHKSMSDPVYKAKKSAGMKRVLADPEVKAKLASATKRSWANPSSRAKRSASIKESLNTPEVKAKHCEAAKAAWARRKARLELPQVATN